MKNLIIEDDHEINGLPIRLKHILESRFKDNREVWYDFGRSYYPDNREETLSRFFSLTTGDNIVCQTVFVDFQQLEIMIDILVDMKEKYDISVNFYIHCYDLKEEFKRYISMMEAEFTPNTDEYNDSPNLRRQYKLDLDMKFEYVIKNHNIYELHRREKNDVLIAWEDLI